MSAYNWILIKADCPYCNKETEIKCQSHLAASFDGDSIGRFLDATYRIGDKMRWWPPSDYRYNDWRDETNSATPLKPDDAASECCYSECTECKNEVYALIQFKSCTPVSVVSVGKTDNWPDGFYK